MSKEELLELIKNKTNVLSEDSLAEVLEFIEFKKTKEFGGAFTQILKKELKNLDENSLLHLEKEFENYRVLYPHED